MRPDYRRKIKTREALAEEIGRQRRQKPVIMCHGVFDIVHPGHLRHLMYAKEKADLLLASLTADIYITKGQARPYVPQDLRAANLAALEMVDYVVIDENPTPIENILDLQPVIDKTRPTPYKERFICENYKMLQVDRVDNRTISDRTLRSLCEDLRAGGVDAVIFSDFRHGIINRETISTLKDSLPAGVFKVADSQVSNRWGNILDFTQFDLITPNEREARFALGDQDSTVRPMASKLFALAGCKALILKLGERGLMACRSPGPDPGEFFSLDSFVERLVDPMGAGDGLLAATSLAMVSSGNMMIGAILGAVGAAVTCEMEGNIPLTRDKMLEKIASMEKRACYG